MSIPETESIGKTRWTQGAGDDDKSLELRIPLVLEGIRPRDLKVVVKGSGTVLSVGHGDTCLLQWRLYAPIADEIEWHVENSDLLVVAAEKKTAASWSSLLELPLKVDDPLFVTLEEMNRMFASQLPPLPPVTADGEETDAKPDAAAADDDDDDLDKLLDQAAKEVKAADADDAAPPLGYAAYIKAELQNYKSETEEIANKLKEVTAELELEGGEPEARESALKRKDILEEMLRLHDQIRALRAKPSSLSNLVQCTLLDLQKARVNIGEKGSEETEEFRSEEEKALTATQLMAHGLQQFQTDIHAALHSLRLAAIHHRHDQSIVLLYDIYSQLGSPRGAYMLLQRALDDDDLSATANQKVGELYDEGARHFLPIFPAALHFYQRAARQGSVNAMLSLAQLWLRGSTSTSMMSDEDMEAQKDMTKYHAWLDKAIDRGCGSALFVKGCMYIKGEHGVSKSYEQAKFYLDGAVTAQPQILQRAPQIPMMLENLRMEEKAGGAAAPAAPAAAAAAATSSAGARQQPGTVARRPADEAARVSNSAARLNALSTAKRGPVAESSGSSSKRDPAGSARRRRFWERAAVVATVGYGVYSLAFPIRAILLPAFYSLMMAITDIIPWLGNPNIEDSLGGF
ncbi:hypothetical protein STCU_03677 [Strigomonas culicis]|uniref:ATOM69 protein n=1 Tax=Strigomonas culicis TaxID=28005 RepID=S9VV17_9TRYP|eukprot:EPY27920.1 hypothetical protein STCU_05418 [Strigomonas culicis]